MSRHHTVPHVPRAYRDPINGPDDAIALLSVAIAEPLCYETIAIALDDRRCGGTITVVSDTVNPDAVVDVAEVMCMAMCKNPSIHSLLIASVRPGGAVCPGDVDRWLEASAIADSFGLELLEWFVIGPAGIECPRDLFGEPARW